VYYATTNVSGVVSWTKAPAYPISARIPQCLSSSNYVYCIGGFAGSSVNSSYYSETISAPEMAALSAQNSSIYPIVYVLATVAIVLACGIAALAIWRIAQQPIRLDSKEETEKK
jgi:hypothetical protein